MNYSAFRGRLSMESQPQNPEFRNNYHTFTNALLLYLLKNSDTLTLCILMEFYIHNDTISMGLFIL